MNIIENNRFSDKKYKDSEIIYSCSPTSRDRLKSLSNESKSDGKQSGVMDLKEIRSRRRSRSTRRRSRSTRRRSRSTRRRSRSYHKTSRSHRRDSRSKRRRNPEKRSHQSRSSSKSERNYVKQYNERRKNRSISRSNLYADDVKEIQEKLTDDEKDSRTINIWQLSQKVQTRDIEDFFGEVGKLCVVRLILDPRSGKSKGVAYIQFRHVESVDKALRLTGKKLLGFPVMIRTVSSEKCRAADISLNYGCANLRGPTKLCVSNLHPIITTQNLEEMFNPYGNIIEIKLSRDINGNSLGTAFVTFQKGENAKTAMNQLNDFLLANRNMKISPITEKSFGNELDESLGVQMTRNDRMGLMAKLAVGTSLQVATSDFNNSNVVISTQCISISNMFDVEEIKCEEFCKEIEEDILGECSKYGGILHVYLDKTSCSGNIYMKFETVPAAANCVNSTNGRLFDGRVIKTSFVSLSRYRELFPESEKSNKSMKY